MHGFHVLVGLAAISSCFFCVFDKSPHDWPNRGQPRQIARTSRGLRQRAGQRPAQQDGGYG